MTSFSAERVGNFLLALMAVPFGLAALATIVRLTSLLGIHMPLPL